MAFKDSKGGDFDLELWCSWLSRLLYTQKVLGSNPSSSTFYTKTTNYIPASSQPSFLPSLNKMARSQSISYDLAIWYV